MEYNYAVFILTHGRPDNIYTYHTLKEIWYTWKIYFILDSDDTTIEKYKDNFWEENIIVFNKSDYIWKFDRMDNLDNRKTIVYARNASYDIARNLWLDYFFEYEDDYHQLQYRHRINWSYKTPSIQNINKTFELLIDTLERTWIYTIAFWQCGEYMWGASDFNHIQYKRKAMNTFVFKVNKNPDDDLKFIWSMNDDVNAYLIYWKIWKLYFQIADISLAQSETQKNNGWNTEIYKKYWTYVKSMYSLISNPSCVKIWELWVKSRRIHHKINWNLAVPKILKQYIKK